IAPRPLLISNTDSDGIFPLDGVVRTFEQVRRIYRLYDATEKGTSSKVALNISPGPHKDTQELQVHAFRWFNHYLKGDDSPVEKIAVPYFTPEQLQVFKTLPADQKNTEIQEPFVPAAPAAKVPADKAEWEQMRKSWRDALIEKSFRGFLVAETDEPRDAFALPVGETADPFRESPPLKIQRNQGAAAGGVHLSTWEVSGNHGAHFTMFSIH